MKKTLVTAILAGSFALAIADTAAAKARPSMDKQPFGSFEGKPVFLYTLKNAAGMEVKITNYGGTVTSIKVPDRNKNFEDVVLGFDTLDGYTSRSNSSYFGALIGRYANRLGKGSFQLAGKLYQVPTNDGPNSLHGGTVGFNKRVWDPKDVSDKNGPALELHYLSPDGEMGFPGNLNVTVRYSIDSKNGLHIDYSATTDQQTVLNLTNHSYFNLAGSGTGTVLKNLLTIESEIFTPVDGTLIPTGVMQTVAGSPFDFRKATEVGSRINQEDDQLKLGKGYDHNFVLRKSGKLYPGPAGGTAELAAKVEELTSGRVLEVYTDQPGIQFYTGNFLDGANHGIGGAFQYRGALCLETQHFPDSPNHVNFPSAVLDPGQPFHSSTIYRFTTE